MKETPTFKEIVERLGNDAEIARMALRVFKESCPQLLQHLNDALKKIDPISAANAAHKIKGAISMFGFSDLSKRLKVLELSLRADGVAPHLILAHEILAELRSAQDLLGHIYSSNK